MDINTNLKEKLESLPEDIRYIAIDIIHELERGKKSNTQIEKIIIEEIRELLMEEGF